MEWAALGPGPMSVQPVPVLITSCQSGSTVRCNDQTHGKSTTFMIDCPDGATVILVPLGQSDLLLLLRPVCLQAFLNHHHYLLLLLPLSACLGHGSWPTTESYTSALPPLSTDHASAPLTTWPLQSVSAVQCGHQLLTTRSDDHHHKLN